MAKYHINPKTGNPGKCTAKRSCPFGDIDSDHYDSREEAQAAYEKQMSTAVKAPTLTPAKRTKKLVELIVRPNNLDYDIIRTGLEYVKEWEEPWTEAEKSNLTVLEKVAELTAHEDFTAEDEKEARKLIADLAPIVQRPATRTYRNGRLQEDRDPNAWRARDTMLISVTEGLLTRRLADKLTFAPVEGEETNERLLGLREAQDTALRSLNHASWHKERNTSYMGNVEPYFQEAISRVVRGDEGSGLTEGEGERSLLPERERIFNALAAGSNSSENQLYLATVFPVRELKTEMDRVGLDGVSVSTLDNGREAGNVYTVMTPDGGTRSFAVYEHRNSDSIVINGKENWDGKELPYAGDSSHEFFAEFEPDDRKRAAQALTFYMMQAQSGDLGTDEALAESAVRRDWNAILDNSVPGFKAWRQSKVTDTYIAPEDETEEEMLSRLDFKTEE
jgi:hypothetical protein